MQPWRLGQHSIATRVLVIVSLFAVIILSLLGLVLAEMDRLAALRACVKAEGLWFQAQKEAIFHLEHYTHVRDDAEFQLYLKSIQVPLGDHEALSELMKRTPNMAVVRKGLERGRNDPEDIEAIVSFFRRSRDNPHFEQVMSGWGKADALIAKLGNLAASIQRDSVTGVVTPEKSALYRTQLHLLNEQLGSVEKELDTALSNGAHLAIQGSRNFVYGSGALLTLLGIALSWMIAVRIRAIERSNFENEQTLHAITASAQDAVIMLDGHGHITFWNHAAYEIFGYSDEEALGQDLHYLLAPERFRAAAAKGMHHFRLTGDGAAVGKTIELLARHRHGHEFPIELSLSTVHVAGDWNAIGIARDISDRKRHEDEISRLNEELEHKVAERSSELLATQDELVRKEKLAVLGVVAGSVGHELRNPLGVINNAVYFLQNVLTEADPKVRDYLAMIQAEVGHAERIVSELLDAVRTKPPRLSPVTVRELIDMSVRHCTVPPNVDFRMDLAPLDELLAIDPEQMQQVFCNLINNGLEAMPEGGALTITARDDELRRGVIITVRDSGTGIAPEHRAKLFQPLFTTKTRGIGLGLVVVKNLLHANGGAISVESAPGKGTAFSVLLPTEAALGSAALAKGSTHEDSGSG